MTLSDALKANDYVVLYFYNQDGSPGCSIEAQRFESAIPQFTAKKARVLGVSMDSLEKHEEFCDSKGLKSFTLLSDNDGASQRGVRSGFEDSHFRSIQRSPNVLDQE